jgi:hypothetical protein
MAPGRGDGAVRPWEGGRVTVGGRRRRGPSVSEWERERWAVGGDLGQVGP